MIRSRRRAAGNREKEENREEHHGMKGSSRSPLEVKIPNHFLCPISLDLMTDPVTLCTGITYDRQCIETWLEAGNLSCPVTNQLLNSLEPIPNHAIRRMIQDWCDENHSLGVQRIPTPKIPITSALVFNLLADITTASRCKNAQACREAVQKLSNAGRESDRNRRCIVKSSVDGVLVDTFQTFSSLKEMENNDMGCLEEILALLAWLLPFHDNTAQLRLTRSTHSLNFLIWFSKGGSLAGRRNAVRVMREIAAADSRHADALANADGLLESLTKMVRAPICPIATKDSLATIYHLISCSPSTATRFAEMGLVAVIVEMLADSEKSISEKALGILEGMLDCEKGREMARRHSLTVPMVVKKMFRVSELATGFAVSTLWKLCMNGNGGEGEEIAVECLEVGAFQKVLLLLQVGCTGRTKEKATELLKVLNGYRCRGECIDSMDFKQLKRSF